MWSAHVVMVGGKYFSWKGNHLHEKITLSDASAAIGSLARIYFPEHGCKEKVEIHHMLFEDFEHCQSWIENLEKHPDSTTLHWEPLNKASKPPLKKAIFELTEREANGITYWWVVGDIQRKPWDEIND